MSYRASIRPNVVVPFHRWTTCGPRQLHTKFGPNIRTTSIPAGPLSFMFSHFTIQKEKIRFLPSPALCHTEIYFSYFVIYFIVTSRVRYLDPRPENILTTGMKIRFKTKRKSIPDSGFFAVFALFITKKRYFRKGLHVRHKPNIIFSRIYKWPRRLISVKILSEKQAQFKNLTL